jgi:hypothetical protein
MSQVIRKFENSGKIEQSKPELFERSGVGKYNKADLVAGLYRNIDTYIKNNNLSGDKAISFRNSANQFIKGIESGTITMNGDGTFSDSTGNMASSGKFDRNWIGRKKNNANNAFNLVGDYALDYINQMQQYSEPAAKPKAKFNTNDYMTKEISKRWYGGNNVDFDNFHKNRTEQERNALIADIFNNANYEQLYQDYDWTDTGINSAEDLATRGRNFGTAISNNTLDNDDYNTFAALGGTGLDRFMKAAPVETEPTPEQTKMKAWEDEARAAGASTPEAISAYVQGKQREEADRNAAIIRKNEEEIYNRERDAFFNDYATKNPFKGTMSGYVASNTTYNPEKQNEFISSKYGDNYGGFVKYMQAALDPRYFRGELRQTQGGNDVTSQHLANNLDMAIQSGYLDDLGDGNYGIPGTYNYDNWSFISYNPSTKQYKETSMLVNDSYKKLLAHPEYDKRHTAKKENGGIVKFQGGGDTKEAAYLRYKQQFAKKKEEKKQQVEAKAKATKRTPEQVEAGERKPMADGQEWEYEDYARLLSAGADVGSMIASFVPGYGTVASAGLGLGSTLGNFTADLADESVGIGDAFLNAGLGVGMDLVGLIPGLGAAGKGSKIVKNLLKLTPKLVTIWSTSTSFAPAMQAFTKLKEKGAKEMTVDDWKALANGLTAAAGATRWGAAAARNKRLTNQYGTTMRTVTTKSGKQVQMSEDEFQRIRRASGIEGQNQALQSVKGAEKEELPTTFKSWYNPKRVYQGTPEASKNITINTGAMRRVTPEGTVLEPTKLSNEGIWRSAVNNSWGGDWKTNWFKDWGYAPTKGNTPQPAKPAKSKKPQGETKQYERKNTPVDTSLRDRIDRTLGVNNSNLTGDDVHTRAYNRMREKEYQRMFDEADQKALKQIRTKTAAKNKREQYGSSMADDAIALKYWRKRYPKRTAGLSDNDLLDLIEQQKIASRDPQGRLKFNTGGVVQFLQGGKPVGRIKAKDMSGWDRAKALASYDWVADFDRWASQHKGPDDVVDSYMIAFNGGEDIYDQLTGKTGDYFDRGKYNYSVQDPLAKQRQITFRGTNQGFDDLIRSGIVGYGTTEGKDGYDIYAGDRTGNRTLSRGLTAEDVARFNNQLASRGMELYDKGNGAYRLRRLQEKSAELPELVVTADAVKPKESTSTNTSSITPAGGKKNKGTRNFNVMPEDFIALGRMVGGLAANNMAAKLYKEGLKPTLLDTFENTVPLQGNFQAKTNAEQQAGNLESVAARPRTSDASLQLAGELEASDRAGQARFQGGLQDAEMFYKTRMLGQQESDAAKARRVEVANRNRASMNQIDAAKKQIDAARVTANYQQVIAPWLAGIENQFAQKRAMNQQLDMEEAQRAAANNNDYSGWQTSNTYKSLVNRRKTLNDNVSQFLLDKRRGIMGSPYMFQFGRTPATKIAYSKSGSKLTAADREKLQRAKDFNKRLLEDNKQFHKDIMESKREHNKLIMSMSSLTSELIKKAMS